VFAALPKNIKSFELSEQEASQIKLLGFPEKKSRHSDLVLGEPLKKRLD
jgi:hypothetical protein